MPHAIGTRVYNYYDGGWVTVRSDPKDPAASTPGWFLVEDEAGNLGVLNSVRVAAFPPDEPQDGLS